MKCYEIPAGHLPGVDPHGQLLWKAQVLVLHGAPLAGLLQNRVLQPHSVHPQTPETHSDDVESPTGPVLVLSVDD